jgi:hypothetical protein
MLASEEQEGESIVLGEEVLKSDQSCERSDII